MTNEEMKMALTKDGLTAADIEKVSEKFDAEKITEIVEAASTPKEALEALHAFYPELEVEALQKQCDFVMEQVEAAMNEQKQKQNVPMELTEEELDNVAGGGFFDSVGGWFKKNWKKVAIGAAIVVGAALICTGVGAGIGSTIVAGTVNIVHTTATAIITEFGVDVMATGIGAAIGAGVGAAVGGAVVGGLAGTDNLPG